MPASFLGSYRSAKALQTRFFSRLVAGGFHSCGRGCTIMPPIRVKGEERISLGDGVFLGPGCWLATIANGRLRIGDGTQIAGHVTLSALSEITVGRKVLFAQGIYVGDHNHAFARRDLAVLDQGFADVAPVAIGDGAWLAEHVVVLPGVTIGRGAVIGANAVVNQDIPEFAVAVGAPARVVRIRPDNSLQRAGGGASS